MKIVLAQGETLTVELDGSGGEGLITISHGGVEDEVYTIDAEYPDTEGRVGRIYAEEYGKYIPSHEDMDAAMADDMLSPEVKFAGKELDDEFAALLREMSPPKEPEPDPLSELERVFTDIAENSKRRLE